MFDFDLDPGTNIIKVKVTAEDSTTTETYTVRVTQEAAGFTPTVTIAFDQTTYIGGVDTVTITLTRNSGTTAISVPVQLQDPAGENILTPDGVDTDTLTVSFSRGETAVSEVFPQPAGTGTGSGPQTVTATISSGAGYQVGTPSSATASVLTQPGRIYFFLDNTRIEVTEGIHPFAIIPVKARTRPGVPEPNGSFRFHFATNPVTATARVDYLSTAGIILFRAGDFSASGSIFEASQTVLVGITNDTVAEPTETFSAAVTRFAGLAATDDEQAVPATPSTVSRYDDITGLTCTDCATETTVSIFDDDSSTAVLVTDADNLQTGEDGAADTFKVRLRTKPSADVSIALTSSDTGEGTVAPTPLTFTTANWYVGQTVTVSGVDDTDADGDQSYQVTFLVTSADTDYHGITVSPVSVTNADDEAQVLRLTVSAVTGDDVVNIQEKADGFAVTGRSMTVEGVAVTVVIGASGDLSATSDSAGNWSVAVPPNAPYITQGTLTITVNATLSGYEAMEVTRQFTVDLLKPTILVGRVVADTITLTYNESLDETSVPDGGAYTVYVNGSSVPLAATNPVTIRDGVVTITLAAAVSDTDTVTLDYTVPTGAGAMPIKNLFVGNLADAFTNQDLSRVGVLVTDAADLQTNEDGSTDTFKVKLLSRPSDRVSIALMSSDTGEGIVAPTPLTFTTANWDAEQTVTVSGVDDTDQDGDQGYQITFAVTSTDTDYSGITVSPVSVTNIDDEAQALRLTVSAVTGDDLVNIQEKADGFAVTGRSMTVEGVAVTVVIGGSGDLSATSDSAGSWSVAVPPNASYITEGALDVTVNATLSGYEAMEVTRQFTVDLTKPAVDTATVASTVITLTYNESLDATSVPDGGAYTVNVNGSSVALAAASPVAISGSVVTITLAAAVSDTDTVTVDYTVPTGAGAMPVKDLAGNAADGLSAQSVSGVGVLVTDADNLQTGEDGTADTFKVRLATKPSAAVSIALTSSDTGEGIVAPTPLTFTATNWDTEQTVTVSGVDDTDADGDQSYRITFAVTSTDTDYHGITVSPVPVTNADDEAQALQLTVSAVTGDDVVNIQEKADGFAVTGRSMTVEGVAVTVVIGGSGDLSATSDSAGNWSVAVPPNAPYITEGTLTITVNATIIRLRSAWTRPAKLPST